MTYIKFFHVLSVFIWIGNLLALTRLMGYHVKLETSAQMSMAAVYKRMYYYIGLPSMFLAVTLGVALLAHTDPDQIHSWILLMTLFAMPLIACDLITGFFIGELNQRPDTGRGIKYKILHGMTGLFLIALLGSVYLLKP
jgi:uncharacterized membrane protein